ncbi:DUF481 domain-containing protein [Marinobacter sp. M216]|uniref:DUF481 domain-containing protein n=1 Tax=Marinobacter albus TaxID=3030833 RepID=A0ABT7H8Y0_9GAMM|nr:MULTISPECIES: DUF481 domain-containing protein [unclassified Marinobacter]MBW7470919.1 DUF481 domain-containing protein [Marinobacter sp. F4218]MDK9556801.1 DUF481 domain-containing protein [Marinobacter sp. M216]
MELKNAVAIALIGAAPLAQAQDRGDVNSEFEIGILVTSGNTEESNLNGRLAIGNEFPRWRNMAEFSARHTESEDETTAEQYQAEGETNYKFDERQYWFLRGAWEDDRFSGYDFESSVTAGYGNRLWESGDQSFWSVSTGLGYRYNRLDEPDENGENAEDSAIARFATQFDYAISDRALFRQKLSTEVGLEENNTISESETALQATVVGNLSMKAAFRVKHVSDPPEGKERTDTETALTLLYTF